MMLAAEAPWWTELLIAVGIAFVTAAISWVGFQLRNGAKATDRAIDTLAEHLRDIKPEIRMLRMAINNNTLQHTTQLDKALDATLEEHEKTQALLREQGDRIIKKIENTP